MPGRGKGMVEQDTESEGHKNSREISNPDGIPLLLIVEWKKEFIINLVPVV